MLIRWLTATPRCGTCASRQFDQRGSPPPRIFASWLWRFPDQRSTQIPRIEFLRFLDRLEFHSLGSAVLSAVVDLAFRDDFFTVSTAGSAYIRKRRRRPASSEAGSSGEVLAARRPVERPLRALPPRPAEPAHWHGCGPAGTSSAPQNR